MLATGFTHLTSEGSGRISYELRKKNQGGISVSDVPVEAFVCIILSDARQGNLNTREKGAIGRASAPWTSDVESRHPMDSLTENRHN